MKVANATDEIGKYVPMTFPRRMMTYVLLDLLIINLITYYLMYQVQLEFVLSVTAVEIIALAVAFAFWVPRYKLRW